jgi:hypothetical protein
MSQIETKPACDLPEPQAQSTGRSPKKMIARAVTIAAVLLLVTFIVFEGVSLWSEFNLLQDEIGGAQHNQIVGYLDIAPLASYAAGPPDWFRGNGGQALLWSRWEEGVGHHWFQFAEGEIAPSRLQRPPTNFVSRPIDYPLIETNGGEIWRRIPMDSSVVGQNLRGVNCVYPLLVLGKVQVVNDMVQDHPFLVAINLFAPQRDAVSIFDADHDGHRVTMAATGYFQDNKPIFYDRGTESLWIEEEDSLKAIAGTRRGKQLRRVAHPAPVTWKSWLAQNQRTRLLVGADRTHGIPHE